MSVQVLTPADDVHHINKHNFKVPFVCGCRDLGEALRRIAEGAAMIRTKVRCMANGFQCQVVPVHTLIRSRSIGFLLLTCIAPRGEIRFAANEGMSRYRV